MAAAMKMDELLVTWLSSDEVYERVLEWIENYRAQEASRQENGAATDGSSGADAATSPEGTAPGLLAPAPAPAAAAAIDEPPLGTDDAHPIVVDDEENVASSKAAAGGVSTTVIPPFYPRISSSSSRNKNGRPSFRRRTPRQQHETWEPLPHSEEEAAAQHVDGAFRSGGEAAEECARDQARAVFYELGVDPPLTSPGSVHSASEGGTGSSSSEPDEMLLNRRYLTADSFVRITKEVCRFPSFFNLPLYQRILDLWNSAQEAEHQTSLPMEVVTYDMLSWYWKEEMEPYDAQDRFYRLVKQPDADFIVRDDFLPFIKALLNDHPGLEFLTSHAEFQEKYAVTVITRIFYCVNRCHSGRITSRQIRRSDLLEAFQQVDEEEDINNVTRYFSYEHFYVLYCRFWELDHDRDYRITREDLLKYGDHSLSHMIVDRIFDAAPRPFNPQQPNRDFLSYEDFIYFMLSEEDKSNEVSVRYWFTCVDVDGDNKLNNMEMRSFYAVQLHRMQMMGHEIVPFEDMLCQMMDMIKPANAEYLVPEDFLQPECAAVSGALFDALVNLNKYLLFEQRDPFAERQKREDEFECDWDRFACIDYKRLAMEEEAREEEAMEIDWVTDDEDDHHQHLQGGDAAAAHHHQQLQGVSVGDGFGGGQPDPSGAAVSEAPF